MNQLIGTISRIQKFGRIILGEVDTDGHTVSVLMIDLPQTPAWFHAGSFIIVIIKEIKVSLRKKMTGEITLSAQFPYTIKRIKRGEILRAIEILFSRYHITSAISTRSVDVCKIYAGGSVTAFIKANEIILTELMA